MTEINTDSGGRDANQLAESTDAKMQAEIYIYFFTSTVRQYIYKICKTQKLSYKLYMKRHRKYVKENTIVVGLISVETSAIKFITQ